MAFFIIKIFIHIILQKYRFKLGFANVFFVLEKISTAACLRNVNKDVNLHR